MLEKMKSVRWICYSLSTVLLLGTNIYAEDAADTTFGTNGKVLEVLSEENGGAQHKAVLVQEDDRIIAAGITRDTVGDTILAIYKYLPNGSRDMSFGSDGVSYADHVNQASGCSESACFPHGQEDVDDIMLQSDGKIIITRTEYEGVEGYNYDPYFGIARFNTDGTLDTTYGYYHGYSMVFQNIYFAQATAGAIQADDKVLVTGDGRTDGASKRGMILSRFNSNGSVDLDFANEGTVYLNTSPEESYYQDSGLDVSVQPDGKILVAGQTQVKGCENDADGIYTRGLLLRFNPDGSLDSSFDGDGILKFNVSAIFDVKPWDLFETYPCQNSIFKSVSLQEDGKIVVMGNGYNAAFNMFLARFNPDGTLDTTFGYQGAIAAYENYDYTVAAFDHLNTNFAHVWGRKYAVENMMVKKNGNIVASGHITYDDDYYHYGFMALHFTRNGEFDKRYGAIGDARVDVSFPDDFLYGGATAFALAEQKNGQVLLAGYADGYEAPSTAVLTRTKEIPKTLPAIYYLLF